MRFCYNCQAGLHGFCSMSWCSCPKQECQTGAKPVSILEEVFEFYFKSHTLTKEDLANMLATQDLSQNLLRLNSTKKNLHYNKN